MRKIVITTVLLFVGIIGMIYLLNVNSSPFKVVYELRKDIVRNHKLLTIEKMKEGELVHSVAQVNDENDNMYFIDIVQKTLIGYKWVGGGSHINRDIGFESNDFIFSAQLLNEKQIPHPTIFGICLDENIKDISVRVRGNYHKASIYDGNSKKERYFVITFEDQVANYYFFQFELTYSNGEVLEFIVSNEDVADFQKGHQRYFYYE